MNKAIFSGHTTRPIEFSTTKTGTAIAKTSIATNDVYYDKEENKQENTMFMELVFFGKAAKTANEFMHKGKKILVEGRVCFEQWNDQTGAKRSRHYLHVTDFEFIDAKSQQNEVQQNNNQNKEELPGVC